MSELLDGWLAGSSPYLVLLVPGFAFLECCVGVGLFVSGIFLLTTSTVLYANDISAIETIVALAFAGALLGDHAGYLVGKLAGPRLLERSWLARYRQRVERVLGLVEKSTPITICVGRLSPPIRSFTPLVTGLSGVSFVRFSLCDLLACSIWATGLYLLVTGISSLPGLVA